MSATGLLQSMDCVGRSWKPSDLLSRQKKCALSLLLQHALSKINRHTFGTSFEAAPNVFLALRMLALAVNKPRVDLYLVHQVLHELFLAVSFDRAIERIEEVEHTRSYHGLLHWRAFGKRLGLLQVLVGICLVPGIVSKPCLCIANQWLT
jgi:hypothetical protein